MSKKFEELAKQFLGESALKEQNFSEIENRIIPERSSRNEGTYSSDQNSELSTIEALPEYEFILRALNETDCPPLFVTGEAGTGKSTLIHWLYTQLADCAIVAPTAIAAVNVSGSTIHGLFSLPAEHIDTDSEYEFHPKSRVVVDKVKYLIVDEVSMVSPNIIDTMHKMLQNLKRNEEPFGGVRMIFIGDLLQLPPVVSTEEERIYFSHRYRTPYFFSADIFKTLEIMPVALKKVRRQKDSELVKALGHIRFAQNHRESVASLNRKCFRDKDRSEADKGIFLVPTNADARAINTRMLDEIQLPIYKFEASITGHTPANKWNITAPHILELKLGARVILLKNNNPAWINGDLGEVVGIDQEGIRVKLINKEIIATISKAIWSRYRYTYDYASQKIEKQIVATFEQYPLTLGWAITIHKSQGMTLEHLTVDFGAGAFAPGQAYVALSRAKNIDGLTLERAISMKDIKAAPEVIAFYEQLGIKNI